MDKKTYDKGLEVRKAVLGEAYVNNALKNVDDFNKPFQELLTEYCWGAVWGREELPRKTRSMLNLAMISILNRPHELRTHIKGALTNGVTKDEIREIFMQVAIYAGAPAGVDSFRIAREVFAEWTRVEGEALSVIASEAKARVSVIASEAKQSTSPRKERMDCFAALAMTK
jgi:4-carboxymuconolactone decarboxylase